MTGECYARSRRSSAVRHSHRREHANPWGLVPFRVSSRLTGRGWAGAEAGVACEAGGGAGARRDHGDRGRVSRARRGGWPGRPRAEARRGEAAHGGAPGRDGLGAGGRGGRATSRVRRLWTSAGQQGPLPCDGPLPGWRRAGKGRYRAAFRSLFGGVPVRVRRLLVFPCQGPGEPKSFAALDLGAGPAPELAYVTAKFAALAPFGKVAALLSELLPISGAQNAGTVRNRTL